MTLISFMLILLVCEFFSLDLTFDLWGRRGVVASLYVYIKVVVCNVFWSVCVLFLTKQHIAKVL